MFEVVNRFQVLLKKKVGSRKTEVGIERKGDAVSEPHYFDKLNYRVIHLVKQIQRVNEKLLRTSDYGLRTSSNFLHRFF